MGFLYCQAMTMDVECVVMIMRETLVSCIVTASSVYC
jgi:hypothetical protein